MKELKDIKTRGELESWVDEGNYCPQDLIDLWRENNILKAKLGNAEVLKEESFLQEDRLIQENKELRRKKFVTFAEDECWVFSPDKNNHLESLVCPIVIDVDTLRDILWKNALFQETPNA